MLSLNKGKKKKNFNNSFLQNCLLSHAYIVLFIYVMFFIQNLVSLKISLESFLHSIFVIEEMEWIDDLFSI